MASVSRVLGSKARETMPGMHLLLSEIFTGVTPSFSCCFLSDSLGSSAREKTGRIIE